MRALHNDEIRLTNIHSLNQVCHSSVSPQEYIVGSGKTAVTPVRALATKLLQSCTKPSIYRRIYIPVC